MYDRAFRRWKEFALSKHKLSYFPANPMQVGGAANSGVGERVFQRHERWKSVSPKDGYVKDTVTSRISVSKSIFQAHTLCPIRLLINCTLVLGQDMQNKPNGSLCALPVA